MNYISLSLNMKSEAKCFSIEFNSEEQEEIFILQISVENEDYIPRGSVVYKNINNDESEYLRSCGYAVEDEILYISEDKYAMYSRNQEKSIDILKNEMINNLKNKQKMINDSIENVSKVFLQK